MNLSIFSKNAVMLGAFGLAVVFTIGILSSTQNANASSFSILQCFDTHGTNVNNTSVALNSAIHCRTESTNPNADAVHYYVTNANGVNVTDSGLAPYTSGTNVKFSFTADLAGDWSVHSTFYDVDGSTQSVCSCNMHVSFFVLPESSLGAIGLIGSSLGALGLFMHYSKSRKKKTGESSD